jgi:hypothetical protein
MWFEKIPSKLRPPMSSAPLKSWLVLKEGAENERGCDAFKASRDIACDKTAELSRECERALGLD